MFGSSPASLGARRSSPCGRASASNWSHPAASADTSGTFLTATPGGQLSASAPSRGPLEGFTPSVNPGDLFPSVSLKTSSGKYLSVPPSDKDTILGKKAELRADADEAGTFEGLRVKCQREHVLKARVAAISGRAGGEGKTRLLERGGPALGSLEDELQRK